MARSWDGLYPTWGFRLTALAFLVLSTEYIALLTHGQGGMVVLLFAGVLATVFEGDLPVVVRNLARGVALNRALFGFAVWYALCVVYKMYGTGPIHTDFRLVTSPLVNLTAIAFGLVYLRDSRASRFFQIAYILAIAAQCYFTSHLITDGLVDVRQAVSESGGAWAFGNQRFFATQAILLPLFVWRACTERGVLRGVLLACCGLITWTVLICGYGTPAGVLLVGVPALAVFVPFYTKKARPWVRLLFPLALIGGGLLLSWKLIDAPLLKPVRDRIVNVWADPRSGGYDAKPAVDGSRWYLAQISIASFEDSPLFGGGTGSIRYCRVTGGHSSFFDMLGFYGLLGGAGAFIGMLLMMLRRAHVRLVRIGNWESVCAISSMVMLIVAGILNPYWEGTEPAMVLLFGRLYRFEGERT